MFGVSFFELLLLLAVILIVLGPEKLPEAARGLGKLMGTFRKSTDAMRREFYNSIYTPAENVTKELEGGKQALQAVKREIFDDFEDENCETIARKQAEAEAAAGEEACSSCEEHSSNSGVNKSDE